MSLRDWRRCVAASLFISAWAPNAHAYENHCTHPVMAGRSATLLRTSAGGYFELGRAGVISRLGAGAEDEDVPAQATFNHFFNALDGSPLDVPGLANVVFDASQCLSGLHCANEDAISRAERYRRQAVKLYRQGDRLGAYSVLGRSLHLLEDLHQPGHVQNDAHVPKIDMALAPAIGLDGHDSSPLEGALEVRCNSNVESIPAGTEVTGGVIDAVSLMTSAADDTFNNSLFVGGTADPFRATVEENTLSIREETGNPNSPNYCLRKDHWLLTDPITAQQLCFNPAVKYEGGVSHHFDNDWWEVYPGPHRLFFPEDGAYRIYIDRYDKVATGRLTPVGTNEKLHEHFMNFLPKLAVERGAAYLKFFGPEVDDIKPRFTALRTMSGREFGAGEVIDEDGISITAEDPVDSEGSPSPSGLYAMRLFKGGTVIAPGSPLSSDGEVGTVTRTFSGLEDGSYELVIEDGLGNRNQITFSIETSGGPQSKGPKDPPPPSVPPDPPPPNPEIINASYGQSGQVCAETSPSGHFVRCARTSGGQENCLPEPQPEACINWACVSPGNYDIPVEFQDDRSNWRLTHTIHCTDGNPTVKVCKDPDNCVNEPLPPTWNIFRSKMVASVSSGIDYTDLGAPHDCLVEEFIGGGTCQISCTFGDCGITWTKEGPATSGFFPLGYQPPAGRHLEPYPFGFNLWLQSIDDPQLTHTLAGFTYPTHGTPPVGVSFPAVGQMQESCNVMQDTCVMTSSAATTAGWGVAPPPTPSTFSAPSSMSQAALAQGRALLCGPVSMSVSHVIFGAPTKLRQACDVPAYQPTAGAQACYWNGTAWACGPTANAECDGAHCVLTADLEHASTWAFLAPLPSSYPDLTAPTLTQLEVSEDGLSWSLGGQVHASTGASARLTARDPPSGIEVVSGLAANTAPLPFSPLDPATQLLFRFEEGSGTQAFDASPAFATATMSGTAQSWVPGLFGTALDFNGSQSLTVQPDTQLRGQAFTVEAWVYATDTSVTRGIAGKAAGVNRGMSFSVVGGRLRATVAGNAQPWDLTAAEPLPLNQWSLVAMTFENGTLRLFMNGEQRGQMTGFYEPDGTLVIGSNWKGSIDEFRVLSRALSRAELALDYRRGHAAYFTTDGGATWRFAPTMDYGGATEGQPGPFTLTASGLSLSRSTSSNIVELAVADVAGHVSAASRVIPVAPPDTTRPAISNAQVSTDSTTWYQAGSILLPGSAQWRATIADPPSGVALRSGLRVSTEPNQPGLVSPTAAMWHMDEGGGSVSVDSSGNNHDLGSSFWGLTFVPGRFGTGLRFDGSLAFAGNRFTVNTWTVSTWVKLESATTGNGQILNKRDDPNQGFALGFSGNQPFLNVGGAGTVEYLTSPTSFAFNTWHYIAGSYDGTTARLYVDGVLSQQKAVPYTADGGGAIFGLNNLHGVMDETRIVARAMSADELLSEARAGYGAIYSFDSGRTWSMTEANYGGAVAGAPSGVMTVPGLTLADSTTSNLLVVFAQDEAGNTFSATYVLPAGIDSTAPDAPVIASTSLAAGGAVRLAWQPAPGEPPALYKLYREASPITSVAGLTPVAVTTETVLVDAPAVGELYHYALVAQDAQGNVSIPSTSMSAEFDRVAPVVSLSIIGSTAPGTGSTYVAPGATFTISAADLGAVASGLTALSASVDGTPLSFATASFTLFAGLHDVAATAADFSGNNAVFLSSVVVDAGVPVSTLSIAGYQQTDSLGRLIVLADNQLSFSANDPPESGVSAGVASILYRVDGASWTMFSAPVTVPEGQHQVEFKAVDRVGNEEPARSQAFVVALPGLSGALISEVAPDSFRVSWSPEAGASGYVAVVSSAADFSAISFSTAVEQPEVRITGLEPASTYYVRIAFFSDTNDGLPAVLTAVTGAWPDSDLIFSSATVSGDGVAFAPATSTVLSGSTASVRIVVQDPLVGLDPGSVSARYSNDGGATWNIVSSSAIDVAATGASTFPYMLTASGINLVSSLHLNQVVFSGANRAGKPASSTFTVRALLPVAPPPLTDGVLPSVSSVVTFDSSGTALGESQVNDRRLAVTAQALAQDAAPGLSVDSGGFGVIYTTSAGQAWIAFSTSTPTLTLPPGAVAASVASFNGKLYAGSSGATARVYTSDDGLTWTQAFSSVATTGNASFSVLVAFGGKLYAAFNDGSNVPKLYSTADGATWTFSRLSPGLSGNVYSMAAFNGALFAGTDNTAQLYATTDGTDWTRVLDARTTFGAFVITTLGEFKGKLYAGTWRDGRILATSNGTNWSLVAQVNVRTSFTQFQAQVTNLTRFNGRLYAAAQIQQNRAGLPFWYFIYSTPDGTSWSPTNYFSTHEVVSALTDFGGVLYAGTNEGNLYASSNGGTSWVPAVSGARSYISCLAVYGGKLNATSVPGVVSMTPLAATLSGSDGSTLAQTLAATGLDFAASTNSVICGGVFPCAATNQLWFTASDLAGNIGHSGPRAVQVNATPPVFSSTEVSADGSLFSAATSTVLSVSSAGARVTVQDAIVGLNPASVVVRASNDGGANWTLLPSSAVSVIASGSSLAPYTLTASGLELASSLHLNKVAFSATNLAGSIGYSTFTAMALLPAATPPAADAVAPSLSNVVTFDSVGSAIAEGEVNDRLSGVTAQALAQDAAPGLSVAEGFGVMYTTTAGNQWVAFAASSRALVVPDGSVMRLARFGGKLYAGTSGTTARIYSSEDGASWTLVFSSVPGTGGAGISGFVAFGGRLYAGMADNTRVAKLFSTADGATWTPSFPAGQGMTGSVFSLAAFNGALFAGTDSTAQVFATTDGESWTRVLDGNGRFGAFVVLALKAFKGKLYAGTYRDGRILSTTEGANWSLEFTLPHGSGLFAQATALEEFNGRLFAAVDIQQNLAGLPFHHFVYSSAEGTSWSPTAYFSASEYVQSLAALNGKLYAGTSGGRLFASPDSSGRWLRVRGGEASVQALLADSGMMHAGAGDGISRLAPLAATLSGGAGSNAAETLSVAGLELAASTSAATCAGVSPCAATNQLWFTASDLAGNAGGSGPRAVLVDTAPPAAVADLAFAAVHPSSITLRWTAPAASYQAAAYDLRRASFPITTENFASATPVAAPPPAGAGTLQTVDVTGVTEASFYAALKTRDGIGAFSPLSNVAGLTRSTVTVDGAEEMSFSANQPVTQVLLSTETGTGAVVLASAAPSGLLLVSSIYDLGPEGAVFDPPAVLSFRYSDSEVAALGLTPADLRVYQFVPGSGWVEVAVQSVDAGEHLVTASIPSLSSIFALFAKPHVAPSLALIPPNGSTVTTATPLIVASYSALGHGVDPAAVRLSLDGLDVTAQAVVNASSASFTPSPLAQGAHTATAEVADFAGNRSSTSATFFVSLDNSPPLVRLDYPGSSGVGVEQAVGGVVNVRGAVSDASGASWTLEAAPGASATAGFTPLASGVGDAAGLLAAWDSSSLSGYFTLRLRAQDAFGNASSVSAVVFVGKPVFSFAIGRKDAHVIVNKLRNPTGIAVRSDGLIWVAGTDEDSLLLLTSSGAVVAEVDGDRDHGHGHGHGHGKGKGHDDDDEDMSFKNPQGLALDAADNLFVADKGNNRVLKLSPDGSQVLLQLAKVDGRGRPKPGSGSSELRQPWDVAVDGNGDIYVADSGNRRIQVFDSSGTYLRQFGQGVLLSTSEVRGIVLTAEGLWVSDKEQERVFLFSRAGTPIKSIGDADSAVGELSRMRGLASDRLGALYVVEPNRDRTQKFDPQGKGLLAFGSKAGLSKADKHAKRYLTQPIDAAIAPDGSIWITDTGRDRIVRYALPVSGGFGVAAAGGETFSSGSIEPARRLVDHRDGAKVERDDGAGVHVPEGALSADLEITVDKGDENQDKEDKTSKRQEKKVAAASEEVQYGPEGTTFNTPVTLVLPYDANLVASQGLKEDELKVYYWNPSLKDWQVMPSVVDKQNKTVSAQTTHFSGYQVQGPGGGIGVAAIDDFGLRDAYAFPNPSRGGAAVTFRIQPGLADSIEVRVYDLSGRKVHSSSDFRFLGAVDDGNGKGAQNTYDHVWGVSGVGSGVYTYVVTAKRAGQSDIRKTGKVGVIR